MQANYTPKDVERFWGKVKKSDNPDDCWIWIAASSFRGGYGAINIGGKMHRAHRVSYELTFGKIPNGLLVCHKCDNPACCNPTHLFLGTDGDNMADRDRKGRHARGYKLTDEQVSEIRRRYVRGTHGGDNTVNLSREFGVKNSYVSRIVRGLNRA